MSDDDDTPANGTPIPLSGTALIFLDLALAAQSVAVNLREAARQIDGLEGVARQNLAVHLERCLREFGDLSHEAADALKTRKI